MASTVTPLLSEQDGDCRSLSNFRGRPCAGVPQHSSNYITTIENPVTPSHRTSLSELWRRFDVQQSPTSVTRALRERNNGQADVQQMRWLRARPNISYQESEFSDEISVKTSSEYDSWEQVAESANVDANADNMKSASPEFGALYGESSERQDWTLCSQPRPFHENRVLTLAMPTSLVSTNFSSANEQILLAQEPASLPTERKLLNGKTLRPRSALSGPAAKLGLSPQDMAFTYSIGNRARQASSARSVNPAASSRKIIREQISTVIKEKRDRFLYHNRAHLLPLLPATNYVEHLARRTFGPVRIYKEVQQPVQLNATLKPYQVKGLSFLVYMYHNGMPAILGDEMGLGKTLQTLSLFQYLKEKELGVNLSSSTGTRPFLVICPLSVLENWVAEARKFTPSLRLLRFHGPVSERSTLKHELRKKATQTARIDADLKDSEAATPAAPMAYDLVITTYEAFKAESAWFRSVVAWRYVVLDEGHRIKNYQSQEARLLQSLQAEYRVILTGTPMQNNLVEMWSLFHWLLPEIFVQNTLSLFKNAFNLTKGQVDRSVLDQSRRLLELIMLRRMKSSAEINLNLPPKQVIRLFVPLSPMQKYWYLRLLTQQSDDMLEDIYQSALDREQSAMRATNAQADGRQDRIKKTSSTQLKRLSGSNTLKTHACGPDDEGSAPLASNKDSWRHLLNLILQLRKVCTHPYLIPDAAPEDNRVGAHLYLNSGKFMALYKLIDELVLHQGKKMIIFSNFTEVLDRIQDLATLISEGGIKFKLIRLDGSTLRAKRNLYVRLFQQSSSPYKVFLISTKAGGVGLNLTAATEVVFMDEDWNPHADLQAEARCHRIGQMKPVTVYKLCTSGTVEEQMLGRIHKKLYLSAKITEAIANIHDRPSQSDGSQLTLAESKSLFGNYSEFKSLLRRGSQTLANTSTDMDNLRTWNLQMMIEKCQQKVDFANSNDDTDEERWLATVEKVECAVFEGRNYARKLAVADESNMMPTTSREGRRKGKEMTVEIDGFAVSKASLACAQWESVPTYAGKDPSLKDVKRTKLAYCHQDHCQVCYEVDGLLYECTNCPRVYHAHCMSAEDARRAKELGNWSCFQHRCHQCGKKAADAGGVIFRCRWCPSGFCEDCLEWDAVTLIDDTIDEYKILKFPVKREAYYIACAACNTPAVREAFEAQAESYRELAIRAEAGETLELDSSAVGEASDAHGEEKDDELDSSGAKSGIQMIESSAKPCERKQKMIYDSARLPSGADACDSYKHGPETSTHSPHGPAASTYPEFTICAVRAPKSTMSGTSDKPSAVAGQQLSWTSKRKASDRHDMFTGGSKRQQKSYA